MLSWTQILDILPTYGGAQRRPLQVIERRDLLRREQRLEEAKVRIAARLRRVCADLSEGEFDALMSRMAEIELRYAMRPIETFSAALLAKAPNDPS
jgi:geranylgeranyl pyrophosphate synthase